MRGTDPCSLLPSALPSLLPSIGLQASARDQGTPFVALATGEGGLLATLADHSLSALAWEAIGRRACVTVQLDSCFISTSRAGDFLECRGRIVKATRSLIFVDGEITVRGEVVLTASALLKIAG